MTGHNGPLRSDVFPINSTDLRSKENTVNPLC